MWPCDQRRSVLGLVGTKGALRSSPRSSPADAKRDTSILAGVHPVREAFRAGRTLDRILIARGAGGPRIQEIVDLAREHSVPVRFEHRDALDRASNGATHQGVVAFSAAQRYAQLDQVLEGAQLLVGLDGVEDPHNLGAIVRTAHAAGAGGSFNSPRPCDRRTAN